MLKGPHKNYKHIGRCAKCPDIKYYKFPEKLLDNTAGIYKNNMDCKGQILSRSILYVIKQVTSDTRRILQNSLALSTCNYE
jgi:hypothetical protein